MATTIVVKGRGPNMVEYRLERDGRYCEFSLYHAIQVGGFGGTIWPGDMPDLFSCPRGTTTVPMPIYLTDAGKALVEQAK